MDHYEWMFRLERKGTISPDTRLIDEASGLSLDEHDGDTLRFSFTGDTHDLEEGQILVSTDGTDPYKARVVQVIEGPSPGKVEVLTHPVALRDLMLEGSVRFSDVMVGDKQEQQRGLSLRNVVPFTNKPVISDDDLSVHIMGEFEFTPALTVAGDFGDEGLESFDASVQGTLRLEIEAVAAVHKGGNYSKTINLKRYRKFFFQFPWGVPTWEEVILDLNAGVALDVVAIPSLKAGMTFEKTMRVGARLRDGKWSTFRGQDGPAMQRNAPEPNLSIDLFGIVGDMPFALFNLETVNSRAADFKIEIEGGTDMNGTPDVDAVGVLVLPGD